MLLLMMPIIMLSDTWNLVESMPGWLQTVINLSPMRHFVDVAYGIVLKGADVTTIAAPAVKMTLLGAFFSAAGVLRFRRQFR